MSEYVPPEGLKVRISLGESDYTPPNALAVRINLTPDRAASESQYVGGDGWGFDSLAIGTPGIRLTTQNIDGVSLGSTFITGYANVRLSYFIIRPTAINFALFGRPSIINTSKTIKPTSLVYTQFGTPILQQGTNYIVAGGLNSAALGAHQVQNYKRFIRPNGSNFLGFGTARLQSLRNYLKPGGFATMAVSRPRISHKEQQATTRQENPSTLWGKTLVAFGVRYIEQHSPIEMTRFGASWGSFSPRFIEPRGIFTLFPSNHNVAGSRTVKMEGMDFLRFGTRIIPESQVIYPQGITTLFGDLEIYNYVQHIKPKGFLTVGEHIDLRFGHPTTYNLTQYLKPFHDETSLANGPRFPDIRQHQIFNRNRFIQTHGALSQRFGYQEVNNNARLVGPTGIASPIEVELTKTMVAYRIRHFRMEGIEPPYLSNRHIAHLNAALIHQKGEVLTLFGNAKIENTRRSFRFISLGEQSLMGRPAIGHKIRSVFILSDYSIAAPVIPMPEVKLGIRYIEAHGIDSVRYGNQHFEERFTKIAPKWIDQAAVGEPVIKNVTPQLRQRGLEMTEFGLPYIGLYTRYLKPDGINSQAFGAHKIGDRKQRIDMLNYAIAPPQISKLHEIKNLDPGNYLPRRIELKGIETINFELHPDRLHKISQNVLRPESETPMTLFGTARITANSIRVEPGYWEILMGTPRVENKNRTILVKSDDCDFLTIGKPAMSPHTIWAVMDAPKQAIDNHAKPTPRLHYVNGLAENGTSKQPGFDIGIPSIVHKNRRVQMRGMDFSVLKEDHTVDNVLYRIEPKGWNNLRIGVIAPIGDQTVSFRAQKDMTLFGAAKIEIIDPYEGTLRLSGLKLSVFGKPTIDYFHRFVKPVGLLSQAMGTKRDNDRPYLWQGLRIGAFVPTNIGGGVMTEFGTTWISARVREIKPGGQDFAVVNEYDPQHFNMRMFVWNRKQPEPSPTQRINGIGFNAQLMGTPDIKPAVHYIRPDGNSDNFRKGGL